MIRLLVVRHAQSEWNAEGRWQGLADPPLSVAGEAQAVLAGEALGRLLADLDEPATLRSVWSSSLLRARQTAELIGAAAGWTEPPVEVADLREHDVGEWSGLTHPEIEARWPGLIEAWGRGHLTVTPGGEPRGAFDRRVRAGIETLAAAAPAGVGLVVSHGGVVRSVSRWLVGREDPVRQLEGLQVVVGDDGALRVEGRLDLLRRRPGVPSGSEGPGHGQGGPIQAE